MFFKISFNEDFEQLMHHLWSKYGKALFTLDGIGEQMDLNKFASTFFNSETTAADVSVDENANVTGRSVIDFNFEFPKPLQRYNSYYLLWKELKRLYGLETANDLIEKQLTGTYYINDFSDIGRPYCFNFSTNDIVWNGLTMSDRLTINPPKSLVSFIRQVEQFTVYAANSTLGATGLADFLICAAKYIKEMSETQHDGHYYVPNCYMERYILEQFKSFIYTINWEFRGNQSPFTNVSVYDDFFLDKLCNDYGVYKYYVKLAQSLFLRAYKEEMERTALTFPVLTACFTVDEDKKIKDKAFLKFIAKENQDFGHINIYYGDTATLSSCCRLRSETDNEYFNSFGAGSTKIGSLGVVTVNLPRIAVNCGDEFFTSVRESVIDVARINNAKRHIIRKRIDLGAMPLYTLGHMELSKQYSTYGLTGLNEALEILGYDICSKEGEAFVLDLLQVINTTNTKMQKRYDAPHNCEQVPAESSSVKLAAKDKFLGILDKYPFYSNQFIPLTVGANMLERIRLQGSFDKHFSGGAICHVNIGERINNVNRIISLMEYAAEAGVVYWAINYVLHRCSRSHTWVGSGDCPVCGSESISDITRVVGFFTNVKNWNATRREHDWPNRQFYKGV